MRFFIVDDDFAVRSMVKEIIEDADLGETVGMAEDGLEVSSEILNLKNVDILIIDLLMSGRDGIETVRSLEDFQGKIIMLSQVENKEMVGRAYSLNIEYYITKPINKIEVIKIIQKVSQNKKLHDSLNGIRKSLNIITDDIKPEKNKNVGVMSAVEFLLTELGIIADISKTDFFHMVTYLREKEQASNNFDYPSMKEIFTYVAEMKIGRSATKAEINKETKAVEQRIRRAVFNSIKTYASLCLEDFTNSKYQEYAYKLFDFIEIRKVMNKLDKGIEPAISDISINIKKFIFIFYFECKKHLTEK